MPFALCRTSGEIAMSGGTYCLILKLDEARTIGIGKLGLGVFPEGYYVYVGSALNGLHQRIARHLSEQKRRHWHIDYLLDHARTLGTRKIVSHQREECSLSDRIRKISHGIPMKGFGSSDCRCLTHLYMFSKNPLSDLHFEALWTQEKP